MLKNEERKMLVEAHKKGHKSKEPADIFGIDESSVNRIVRQYKKRVHMNYAHITAEGSPF